jgi:ferritin
MLAAWYLEQDQAELTLLESTVLAPDVSALRHQLEATLKHHTVVSQSINNVMHANNELRRDIARLQTQLKPQRTGHAV